MLRKLSVIVAIIAFAGNAFATTAATSLVTPTTGPSGTLPIQGFNKSNNVGFAYLAGVSGSGATGNDVYSVATKHSQGDKYFSGTSASSYVYQALSSSGVAISNATDAPDLPNTASDSTVTGGFGGWSQM